MRTLFGANEFHGQPTPFGVHTLHAEDGRVLIADREVLLHGIYSRAGADLVITTPDGSTYVVRGFFILENPPELTDGADLHIPGQQAAAFAGPVTRDAYAGTPGALGTSVGQARQVDGTVTCTHPNGTTITLKVGDLIYMGDIITTEAGGHLGLVFVDGMSLALGENGDLVIDELVYNPATKGGRAAISLVSGAAEFVSGTIAHSGQDNMTFKTPVGTIGIRGTKVFVAYDPVSGDVSIINRPTGTDPQGNVTAGEIFLTLPNGTAIGSITSGNGGWQWNPTQGQAPQTVQLTEAQVQNVVATVEATVNNLATQAPPQPQAAPGTPAAAGGAAAGGQAGGDAAQGTQPAGQAGGDGGQALVGADRRAHHHRGRHALRGLELDWPDRAAEHAGPGGRLDGQGEERGHRHPRSQTDLPAPGRGTVGRRRPGQVRPLHERRAAALGRGNPHGEDFRRPVRRADRAGPDHPTLQ